MRILSATLCLSALATFATSCSTPWQREPVSKVDNVILYREYRVEKDQQVELNFKHPVDVSKQKMALILSRLIHEYKPWLKSSQSRYVFTPKEVEKSSEKFAEFLGNLQPNERLRFLVSRSQWGGAISGIRATSGVFFVEREGILSVAFDRIVEAISVPQGGKPEDIPFPDDPVEYHGAGRLIPTARWTGPNTPRGSKSTSIKSSRASNRKSRILPYLKQRRPSPQPPPRLRQSPRIPTRSSKRNWRR